MTPEECNAKGIALAKMFDFHQALCYFDLGLELKLDSIGLNLNRGNALRALGRFDEALAAYDVVISLNPYYASVHYNRGLTLQQLGRYAEAVAAFEKVLGLNVDFPYLLGNYLHCKMQICDWDGYDNLWNNITTGVAAQVKIVPPFIGLSILKSSNFQRKCAETYGG